MISQGGQPLKKPLLLLRPVFPFNRWILNRIGRQNLTNQLQVAEANIFPEDYLGIKEILILGLLFGLLFLTKHIEPLWLGTAILLGYVLPDLYLKSRIRARKRLIIKALPETIDLLTLCMHGGLDFMLGLNWVVERSKPNPLTKEFALVIHEIKVGRTRQEALRDMAKRLSIPDISSFITTLIHAERMGTSISEVLSALAEEARRQRFQRGERLALQAPIKMLFPLVVFILPVVGIVVGGPVILQFIQGGLPKF